MPFEVVPRSAACFGAISTTTASIRVGAGRGGVCKGGAFSTSLVGTCAVAGGAADTGAFGTGTLAVDGGAMLCPAEPVPVFA